MAELAFSGIWSDQGSTGLTVTSSTKWFREGSVADSYGISEQEDIDDYLVLAGFLTDSDIDPTDVVLESDFTDDESLMVKNASSNVVNRLFSEVSEIFPENFLYCKGFSLYTSVNKTLAFTDDVISWDATAGYLMNKPSPFTKHVDTAFSSGSGNGSLDTGSFAVNRVYYIWQIGLTAKSGSDILTSLSNSAPTMPALYTYKRLIGAFYYLDYDSGAYYQYYINDFDENDYPRAFLPDNFINKNIQVTYSVVAAAQGTLTVSGIQCMDSTNEYEINIPQSLSKIVYNDVSGAWSEGDGNGITDGGGFYLLDDTDYYIYAILNPSTGARDVILSGSASAPTLPTGYTKYRLVYWLHTYDFVANGNFDIFPVIDPAFVFGFLSASTTQALTAATEAAITATFRNIPMFKFSLGTNSLVYKGSEAGWFKIDIHCSVAFSVASAALTISVYHKPSGGSYSLISGGFANNFLRNATDAYNQDFVCPVYLETNDEIQLRIEVDKSGTITYENYTAFIKEIK